jgi:hypothetical protein
MLSNISDLFTMASLVICMLLSGIIFYYLRTRISMLEQSVMDQAQLLQQVVTSLKSSQYRQQMNANTNVISAQQYQNQDLVNSNQMQMNLIQVSDDDSDDSSSDGDESSDYSHTSESDNDESGNVCTLEDGSCKIIDLSTISSSANYFKPSSHSDIKVIELKSNIHSTHDGVGSGSDNDVDDDDDDDDEDDEYSDDEDDEYSDGDVNNVNKNINKNKESKNNEYMENLTQNHTNGSTNSGNSLDAISKKMKSIVIEDSTTSVSLDEMKNMPVNSLRSLAKTKLSNIDVPTINKMSKKDILKALHVE